MHYQTQNKIRALRKSQKKGASLVIVVCVSAFLVAGISGEKTIAQGMEKE